MLSPYEKIILDRLTAVFAKFSDILQIVVFGSRARGDSTEGSDLDVLVVVKENDTRTLQKIQNLKAVAFDDIEDFSYVNIFPLRASEFNLSGNAFQQKIREEGITVWKRKESNRSV